MNTHKHPDTHTCANRHMHVQTGTYVHAHTHTMCVRICTCACRQMRTDTLSLGVTAPPDQSSEKDFMFLSEILQQFFFLSAPVKIHISAVSVFSSCLFPSGMAEVLKVFSSYFSLSLF